jgi:hypothetical protein
MPNHRVQALAVIAVVLLATAGLAGFGGTAAGIVKLSSDDSRTAHFVFNNEANISYNVTLYVVRDDGTEPYFPLEVTYENGTTRTYSDYNLAVLFASPEWERVEPAKGTILVVEEKLPAKSSLHIAVKNVSPDAESLSIARGVESPAVEWSISGSVCTGSQADVMWFDGSSTSAELCTNVSDISSRNSKTREVVVNTTAEN